MLKLIKRVLPILIIILFTIYYIHKLLVPNFIYMGEEKGFVNYDYVNFRYSSLWTSTVNFGKVISADFFNIITSGTFWKAGQAIGLSPTAIQWWFYFIFMGATIIFTYLALNLISKKRLLSLLLAFIYVTTIMYYSSLDTSPKIIHFLLIPSGLFLWLKYSQLGKVRFLILNSFILISTLSIAINPPQLIGAYSFIFLYILIFSFKGKRGVSRLLFLTPYLINMLFVFLVNILYIKNVNNLLPSNLFQVGFGAPVSFVTDMLRLFGAWWDYAGASGLPYNDAAWYYHSPLGIVLTYIPFFIFLLLLLLDKKSEKGLKIKILAVFIIAVFLVKGAAPPFNVLFKSIYNIGVFKIFREPWAKFMPNFIMIILVGISYLSRMVSKKILKVQLWLLAFFLVLQLFPIASDIIIGTRDVDWKMRDVKIPAYWYEVANWSKKFARDKRILILPAINNNTYNAYPTYYNWKPLPFYGNAPLLFVYGDLVQNDYTEPENAYITKNVIEKIDPRLISSLSIDYVLNQNDLVANPRGIKPYLTTILPALDTQNKITFGKVDIYPVKKDLLQPKIRIVTDAQQIPYTIQKVSNTNYRVNFLKQTTSGIGLIFMERYSKGWTIKGATKHLIGEGVFNFWWLPKEVVNRGEIEIVYAPQTILNFLIGLFIFFHLLALFLSIVTVKLHQ